MKSEIKKEIKIENEICLPHIESFVKDVKY